MKAFLKNYRQAPRKVRLVAQLIKGKSVAEAILELDFLAKRAGLPIKKLLLSAVSNAKNMGIEMENLFIKELRVDKGITMKRMMPAAMGTGHRINKRASHLNLLLGEKSIKAKPSKNLRGPRKGVSQTVANSSPVLLKKATKK
ncbi:MAG: 50S ribosomal protein L22 [Patescibacteria group bacterium]